MGLFDSAKKFAGGVGKIMTGNPIGGFQDQFDAASSAAGGSGGSLLDAVPGIGDARAAAKQNAMNISAAQRQMDFQERMSNSAYQRSMADMKKAGLNPMLAFSQGGASAPSGAIPTINSESKSKLGEVALSSALGMKGLSTQQQAVDQQGAATVANIEATKASAAKQIAETQYTQTKTALAKKDLPKAEIVNELATKGSSVIRDIMNSFSNSAKEIRRDWNDKPAPAPKVDYKNSPAARDRAKRLKK